MKKLLLILLVFSVLKLNAADIYVNNSGQAGTYTTIQAAINAATANDRIFVSPYGVYSENLTIAKSLTLTSAVANTRFSVVGSVTITSAPNQDVIIIGGEFSSDINGNTGTAILANKGNLTVSDCKFASLTCGNFVKSKVLFCSASGIVDLKHGYLIGSEVGDLNISDGPNSNIGDTIRIIGNKILSPWVYANNDNYFIIANNFMLEKNSSGNNGALVSITNSAYSTANNNIFSNNYVLDTCTNTGCNSTAVSIGSPVNASNILVANNVLVQNTNTSNSGFGFSMASGATSPKLYNNVVFYSTNSSSLAYSGGQPIIDNIWIQFSNNSTQQALYSKNPWFFVDSIGRCTNPEYCINLGSPSLEYFDIDLTRNDRGTFGGPYSIDNYWNTANGRARVYDLNMPFEIWNGSTPSIKAEGIHIK